MKILELNIENFLVLTAANIKLADRGLMLIQGINDADSSANSNGAGKSSIADALCWAIYGTTARGESGDAVVNNKAGKNTRVEVKIADDMTVYRIVRHRKHKTGKNALHVFIDEGMGEKDLTKGTDKLTQEVVDKIIGASLEVFTGSIYAGQERMPDLPSMTDKVLKVLIEEAAGINVLEEAYKKARENAQVAKTAVLALQNEIDALNMSLSGLHRQVADLTQSEQDWSAARKSKIEAVTNNVRNVLLPRAKQLAAEAPQSEIDRLTSEIQAIDARIAAVAQEQVQLQALQTANTTETMKLRGLKNDLSVVQNNLQAAKNKLGQVQHRIGCACGECGRPITANELASVISSAQGEVDSWLKVEAQKIDAIRIAEPAALATESNLTTFRQGMTDVTKEVAQRAVLEGQRASLLAKERDRQNIVAQAKRDLEEVDRLQKEQSPFASSITSAQANAVNVKATIQVKMNEMMIRQATLDLETEVVRVFSPAGVRARVLDEVTPFLNAQTSKYLAILSDGNITAEWSTLTVNKAGEVKERFAIDVSSAVSSKTFKGLSGGEKRKVRVATALALQDLVATRATKPIELFIGDEIDHALDVSGLERLMIILDEKAKQHGTVMVISHNSLKDEIKQVLTVERTASGDTKILETAA